MGKLTLVKMSSRAVEYTLYAAGQAWTMARRLGTSKFLRSIICSSAGKFSIDESSVVAFALDSRVIEAVAGVA